MLTIKRWYHEDCTIGRLIYGNFQCFTLELPDLDNQQNISCIPPGEYGYYYRKSPHNGDVLELKGVQGREYVQIHSGSFTRNTLGCILVGAAITFIDGDTIPDLSGSRKTLKRLLLEAGKEGEIIIQ